MRIERVRYVAMLGGLLAGCRGAPPPGDLPPRDGERVPGAERVAVPGAEQVAVPGGGQGVPAAGVERAANPPLLPEEGTLDVLSPVPTPPGTETTAYLRLTANRGYEINEKFHYKLTLTPTPGVTLRQTVFSLAGHDADHLDEHELAITMKLTAQQRGEYTVRGRLDFAVCKIDSQCLPKSMPVAVLVAAR